MRRWCRWRGRRDDRGAVTRFLNVTLRLPVRDLPRTVAFYVDGLGFSARALWPQAEPTFALLQRDEARLQFYVAGRDPLEPVGHGTIFIDVTDGLEVHRAASARCTVEWGPEVYWYGRREVGFRDPDGYLIIISGRTDGPPTCTEP